MGNHRRGRPRRRLWKNKVTSKTFESADDFWRTLFHEIGHILLHGKKDIFIENVEYGDKNPEKEQEADEFASLWMSK